MASEAEIHRRFNRMTDFRHLAAAFAFATIVTLKI